MTFAINDAGDVMAFDGQGWKPAPMAVNDAGAKLVFDGQQWKPIGELMSATKGAAAGKEGGVDNFVRSLARGASMGSADEAAAFGDAGTQPVLGRGSEAATFGQRYDENLAKERAQDRAYDEAYPVWSGAGKVLGGVAGMAAALPAKVFQAPTLIGSLLKGVLGGGAIGGVTGFNEGEGGFENRLNSAETGAGVGATLGGVAPVVAPIITTPLRGIAESAPGRAVSEKVVSPLVSKLADALDAVAPKAKSASLSAAAPEGGSLPAEGWLTNAADNLRSVAETTGDVAKQAAAQRLATALERSQLKTPEAMQGAMYDLGEPGMIADIDQQFFRLARGAKVLPGETASNAEKVLEARDAQLPAYMRQGFTGDNPPPGRFDLMGEGRAYDLERQAVGSQVYGAMRGEKLKVSADMQKLARVPAIQDAIEHIQAQAKSTGTALEPIEIAHRVKQTMNDIAEAAFASGKPVNKADLRDLANQWEEAFWQANPSAKAADTAYAQTASLPGHFEQGYNWLANGTGDQAMNASSSAIADTMRAANPQQAAAVQAGTTNRAVDLTSGRNALGQTRTLAKDIKFGDDIKARLAEVYGADQANEIARRAAAVQRFTKTSQGILGGSPTTDKIVDAMDIGNPAVRVGSGGASLRLVERLADAWQRLSAPNEAVRNEIGRMTLNPNLGENDQVIEMIKKAIDARKKTVNPVRAGLLTSAAGAAGSQ